MSHVNIERIFTSARASVGFALSCLEPVGKNLRARSSFVDPEGQIMHWHEFGDLEGPGWAANAVGGAHLLYRWGRFLSDEAVQSSALRLLDHVLEDGFILPDGFIWPYFDLAKNHFCLNYTHNDDWLCPGSLAKIGVQMLEFAADLGETEPRSSASTDGRRPVGMAGIACAAAPFRLGSAPDHPGWGSISPQPAWIARSDLRSFRRWALLAAAVGTHRQARACPKPG